MVESIITLLLMLNPFTLFVYLHPIMIELDLKDYMYVIFKATLISLLILCFFAFTGNYIFIKILNINFESFRIFGGIVIFTIALIFIIQGRKSFMVFS